MKEIRKTRILHTLIIVLVAEQDYLSLKEIKTKIVNMINQEDLDWTVELKDKRIKNYILELSDEFGSIETLRGRYGGYRLTSDAKERIRTLLSLNLNRHEKNALNDAFEMAMKSQTYHYNKDLISAKAKLYGKKNLKFDDHEYYVGIDVTKKDTTNILKILKEAMVQKRMVNVSFKYDHYGMTKGKYKLKPYFVIHDSDESFIVFKDNEGDIIQNLLNITSVEILEDKFASTLEITDYITKHGIKIKGTVELEFTIIDDRGKSIIDLWNYECKHLSAKGSDRHLVFYEAYKAQEFLYRMMGHIKNLKISGSMADTFKENWNKELSNLKAIK